MTTTTKPAEQIQITETERYEVMKKACLLNNLQLNEKINVILQKISDGTATDKDRREATILAQVFVNRATKK
jgi:hypothetical protein